MKLLIYFSNVFISDKNTFKEIFYSSIYKLFINLGAKINKKMREKKMYIKYSFLIQFFCFLFMASAKFLFLCMALK